MRNHTLTIHPSVFFGLTFLLSWLIWIPLTLSHFGLGPLDVPDGASQIIRLLGVLMPATAALILTGRGGGRPALRALLGRLALWRVGAAWWAAAALVQPALLVLVFIIYNLVSGRQSISPVAPGPAAAFIINCLFLLLATLGEEIGWHGVALPNLQRQRSALASSIILGLVWAAWHIPFWLLLDTYDQFGLAYLALNFLFVMPLTFYTTWFFNHTRSSLLLPVAFHVTFNIVNTALLPVTTNIGAFMVLIILEWCLAGLVLRHLEGDREQEPV